MALLTDRYPSTVEEQSVHLDIEYPDVERDLNRWIPLVKWLLAIPHYVVLAFLAIGAVFAIVAAWFILVTGRYPEVLFNYVVGSDGARASTRMHSCWSRTNSHRSVSTDLKGSVVSQATPEWLV
jgi:hypothetical protein